MTKTTKRRAEQRRKLVERLGGKCSKCGYSKNLASLDFHHIDPSKKEGFIGYLINFHKFSDAEKEAKKCTVLCKNCHGEHHNPDLEIESRDNEIVFKNQELASVQNSCSCCGKYSGGKIYCCHSCSTTAKRKIKDRPTSAELSKMMSTMSFCKIGRKYGVSDNSVRKWAKSYDLLK